MIDDPIGVMALLASTVAFFFWLEEKTKWAIWKVFPPLLPIYALPVVYSNTGLIPVKSEAYSFMSAVVLPVFLVLLLVSIDVGAAIRVMGRGLAVMLIGTAGVVVGAPLAFLVVKGWLGPDAWTAMGALAGSWTGGTGNMAAVAEGLETPGAEFGMAVLADNLVYVVWLPLLLASKSFAGRFAKFARVPDERAAAIRKAAAAATKPDKPVKMRDLVTLVALGLLGAWGATQLSVLLPSFPPVLSASTWKILLISSFGVGLSFTPARNVAGSHALAMALVYLFVANMGAKTDLSALQGTETIAFVAGAYLWIACHGVFVLGAAWLLRVDIHTAAIASAANIGGAASAPIVAAHHDEALVPVSILMAMVGYAVGNYAAFLAAWLCYAVS